MLSTLSCRTFKETSGVVLKSCIDFVMSILRSNKVIAMLSLSWSKFIRRQDGKLDRTKHRIGTLHPFACDCYIILQYLQYMFTLQFDYYYFGKNNCCKIIMDLMFKIFCECRYFSCSGNTNYSSMLELSGNKIYMIYPQVCKKIPL